MYVATGAVYVVIVAMFFVIYVQSVKTIFPTGTNKYYYYYYMVQQGAGSPMYNGMATGW